MLCLYNRDENSPEAECTLDVIEAVAHYACSLVPEKVIINLRLWIRNHLKEWDTLEGVRAWVEAHMVAGGGAPAPVCSDSDARPASSSATSEQSSADNAFSSAGLATGDAPSAAAAAAAEVLNVDNVALSHCTLFTVFNVLLSHINFVSLA